MNREIVEATRNRIGVARLQQANTDEDKLEFLIIYTEMVVKDCLEYLKPYGLRLESFDGQNPIVLIRKHFGIEE